MTGSCMANDSGRASDLDDWAGKYSMYEVAV